MKCTYKPRGPERRRGWSQVWLKQKFVRVDPFFKKKNSKSFETDEKTKKKLDRRYRFKKNTKGQKKSILSFMH